MSELELVGLHEDGEHLVLRGPDGQRFRLPIDEALRAAVRRDRPQLEQLRAAREGLLPPREIQARIRAGLTAEEVAESTGMPLEHVRRYEGPVVDERAFVAEQARGTRVGHDTSAPVLGDLVTDRLATRGVVAEQITWDARREGGSPWTVEVRFVVGDDERSARWTFDPAARTVRALDDEARWLSETELTDGPLPRRHLAAVRPEVGVDAVLRPLLATVDSVAPPAEPEPEPDPRAETEALLEDLADRRGRRQELDLDAEEEFEGFGPQQVFDFEHPGRATQDPPAAHPPASRPDEAVDATVLPLPQPRAEALDDATEAEVTDVPAATAERPTEADTGPATEAEAAEEPAPTQRTKQRRGRASVPSWDEIVFGAKQD